MPILEANLQHAARLNALFSGLQRVHGEHVLTGETDERGKAQGSAVTKHSAPTLDLWQLHLAGKQGIGIVPIRDDNTCLFGGIDIDVYADLDHGTIARNIERFSFPLVLARSKSGGCHLYLFAAAPVAEDLLRKRLQAVAASLGFSQAEIFPKQSKIKPPESGSWLNMPYFDGDDGTRFAIRANGDRMSLSEFLDHAEASKVTAEFFAATTKGSKNTGDPFQGVPLA